MDRTVELSIIRDSICNELIDGDTVTVIKDLKLSATSVFKQGTKAKNIRLIKQAVDGHDIEVRIDGFGKVYLKSLVVKK